MSHDHVASRTKQEYLKQTLELFHYIVFQRPSKTVS